MLLRTLPRTLRTLRTLRPWHSRSACPASCRFFRPDAPPLRIPHSQFEAQSSQATSVASNVIDDTPTVAKDVNATRTPWHSALILSHDVSRTTPVDLIGSIQPVDHPRPHMHPLILLTPSFAHLIAESPSFLQRAAERLYQNADSKTNRIVTAAVVDKLPQVFRPGKIRNSQEEEPGITAFEGMAYTTLTSRVQEPSAGDYPLSSESGSIAICQDLTPSTSDEEAHRRSILHLPLANTVFQTGSPCTMVCARWSHDTQSNNYRLEEWSNEKHVAFHFNPTSSLSKKFLMLSKWQFALIPLTFPRKIESAMGNIVRRLIGDDGTSILASSELEASVDGYFQAKHQSPQFIPIWALVIPKEMTESISQSTSDMLSPRAVDTGSAGEVAVPSSAVAEDQWKALWNEKEGPASFLGPAIESGARLYRVLSGGGGWGKKAGLLALDPSMSNQTSESSPYLVEDGADISAVLPSTQNYVRPDESIQFFTMLNSQQPLQWDLHRAWWTSAAGYRFGVIPNTIDTISPAASSSADNLAGEKIVRVWKNRFGALSEGALTVLQKRGKSGSADIVPTSTRIDAPYSLFDVAELRKGRVLRRLAAVSAQKHTPESQSIAESESAIPIGELEATQPQAPEAQLIAEKENLIPILELEANQQQALEKQSTAEKESPDSTCGMEATVHQSPEAQSMTENQTPVATLDLEPLPLGSNSNGLRATEKQIQELRDRLQELKGRRWKKGTRRHIKWTRRALSKLLTQQQAEDTQSKSTEAEEAQSKSTGDGEPAETAVVPSGTLKVYPLRVDSTGRVQVDGKRAQDLVQEMQAVAPEAQEFQRMVFLMNRWRRYRPGRKERQRVRRVLTDFLEQQVPESEPFGEEEIRALIRRVVSCGPAIRKLWVIDKDWNVRHAVKEMSDEERKMREEMRLRKQITAMFLNRVGQWL